jgi:creatinine amidohydrolase
MRAEHLRPEQLQEILRQTPLVYQPIGTIEWHGQHLPIGNDALKAHGICLRAAALTGGVVMPALYWGVDSLLAHNGQWLEGMDAAAGFRLPGSIYRLSHELFEILIEEMLTEIIRQGVRVVVLLTGHNAKVQEAIIRCVAERINAARPDRYVWALSEYEPVRPDLIPDAGDHAAKWETSLMMALHPELVDMARLSPEGELLAVAGIDPRTEASQEYGERGVQLVAEQIAGRVKELLGRYALDGWHAEAHDTPLMADVGASRGTGA